MFFFKIYFASKEGTVEIIHFLTLKIVLGGVLWSESSLLISGSKWPDGTKINLTMELLKIKQVLYLIS